MVCEVSTHHALQPPSLLGDGEMATPTELLTECPQFRSHSSLRRTTEEHELARLRFPADVREAEEVERLRLSKPKPSLIAVRIAAEPDQASLLGMELQTELLQSLAEGGSKSNRVALVLKRQHDVVSVADYSDLAICRTLPPLLYPEIEHVVQVHVGEQRRYRRTLRCPLLRA